MKNYCLVMMGVLSLFVLVMFTSLLKTSMDAAGGPEWSMSADNFSRYSNFDYFRDRLEEELIKRESDRALLKSEAGVRRRWETFRNATVMSEERRVRNDLRGAMFSLAVLMGVFFAHFIAYRHVGGFADAHGKLRHLHTRPHPKRRAA